MNRKTSVTPEQAKQLQAWFGAVQRNVNEDTRRGALTGGQRTAAERELRSFDRALREAKS